MIVDQWMAPNCWLSLGRVVSSYCQYAVENTEGRFLSSIIASFRAFALEYAYYLKKVLRILTVGDTIMELSGANTEDSLQFHRFHEHLNRTIKISVIGLGVLSEAIQTGRTEKEIDALLHNQGWLWGGMPDWTDPIGLIEEARRDIGRSGEHVEAPGDGRFGRGVFQWS